MVGPQFQRVSCRLHQLLRMQGLSVPSAQAHPRRRVCLCLEHPIAGGNGGRPDSEHVSDHYTAWLKGDYFDMSLVREEMNIVRQDKASTTGAE